MESTDTCLPVQDQEGLESRVKMERSHSILKKKCAEETLVSLSSPVLAGTLPGRGRGPPSFGPAVVHPSPSSTTAAVLAPSISAKAGGRRGAEEGPLACVWLR